MAQGNLLVVDDEPPIRELFCRYLSEIGFRVKTASCAEDALRMISRWRVHVALVDLRLPGIDGLTLIRQLRKKHPDAQIVIVSGAGELEDAIEAIKEQVCYYLRKPPALTELGQTVRLAMDRYNLACQNRKYQAELEASERELRAKKAFIEEIIENVNLFVVGFDLRHRINIFNRLAETVSGYKKKEVLGNPVSIIFKPKEILRFAQHDRRGQCAQDDKRGLCSQNDKRCAQDDKLRTPHNESLPVEFPITTKSEETIDFRWTESRVIDDSGKMMGWIGFGEDLTEIKALERKLILSEKLAATGRLAAAVAHEINNPLQGIKSNFNLIVRHVSDDYKEKFRIPLVLEGLNRIAAIVHRLLDVHRPRSSEIGAIDLQPLITGVYSLLEPTCRDAKIELVQKWHRHPLPVRGSYSDLHQVFLNLMLNSIDAMLDGGKIMIEVSQTEDRTELLFADTGHGIAEEDMDYVFEPFFSTKKDSKGMGLGLSVVRGILESLDGDIEVVKDRSQGACFRITLPTKVPAQAELRGQVDLPASRGSKIRGITV